MTKSRLALTSLILLLNFGYAGAMSTHAYGVIRESIFLVAALACLILALVIFSSLKGGSLGLPWLFFALGFAVAAIGGILHLMDLLKILIHVYDLRLATLLTTCGSMILFLIGLFFYRKGLG